ncbi:MAG TPA: fibronectin type III domain-containing protein [Nocardioides sp.]|nr:fibronectin type III domain-containing protein [Nocardioides sp.]
MLPSAKAPLATATLLVTGLVGALSVGGTADAARGSAGPAPGPSADDPTFRVHENGQVFYVEPQPTGPAGPARAPALTRAKRAAALELHSLPGSDHVIYLDFDGHTVEDTVWNEGKNGMPERFYPGWDREADGPAFSPTELDRIHDIWLWVAEDFAPFDVDVTTEDPGDDAITRTGPADPTYGARVLLTDDAEANASEDCDGCYGVANLDVFDKTEGHAYNQPTWVFPGDNTTKSIADTVSHEVGHNFGLDHDGLGKEEYYQPELEDHDGWGPLMGAPDNVPLSQWSNGDYGGTRDQDDIAVIARNGAPFRADEAGGTVTSAGAFPAEPAIITERTDADVFALGECEGPMEIDARPASVSPNLDIELTLLDGDGDEVAVDDPPSQAVDDRTATGLDASIAGTATSAASYFVRVDGVGRGPATTSYSDYGSVGTYTLAASGCDLTPPVLDPERPERPSIVDVVPGERGGERTATVSWEPPANAGAAAITGYQLRAFKIRRGRVVQKTISDVLPADTRDATWSESGGKYRFTVRAVNELGNGLWSSRSDIVRIR